MLHPSLTGKQKPKVWKLGEISQILLNIYSAKITRSRRNVVWLPLLKLQSQSIKKIKLDNRAL